MRKLLLWAGGLSLAVLVLYWPGREFEFVWDDYFYVEHNESVRAGLSWQGLRDAFGFSQSNWHPLVWLSLMADVEFWGVHPAGFRTTNYVLHAANVVLLFVWLRQLTAQEYASVFVAGIFAVHPLHVESVQWVAERKDVLSMFFGLWTLLAWQRYLHVRTRRQLAWVCLAYLASLMSKQMFVTLPVLLLLLDYWPLQRMANSATSERDAAATSWKQQIRSRLASLNLRSLVFEKSSLIGIAGIFCVVAIVAQRMGGSVQSVESFPLSVRVANAVHVYWLYLGKVLCPKDLIIFYPHPGNAILTTGILAEFLGLVAMTILLAAQKQRRYLIVGWLWYLVAMTPVIGLIQIGDQQMADRYAYLPMLGIFWASTWWLIDATPRRWERNVRVVVGIAALMIFALIAREQIGYWQNNMTLYGHMKVVLRDRE